MLLRITESNVRRICINVITACCLHELYNARGKMHCQDKSRARVEAKDALYFNPEMYTRFILCRVSRRYPILISYDIP